MMDEDHKCSNKHELMINILKNAKYPICFTLLAYCMCHLQSQRRTEFLGEQTEITTAEDTPKQLPHLRDHHRERERGRQKGNWLEKTVRHIRPATIIIKNQMLSLSAWWQLLMEMLQMRPSNNE